MMRKLKLIALVFFIYAPVSVLGGKLQVCTTTPSSPPPPYFCNTNAFLGNCKTYAILRANSLYSSLSNLSSYLSISPADLAEANNGFSPDTNFFSNGQPILIPIDCNCNNAGFFEAELRKITVKGDSFDGIAQSLEGLTTCHAIQKKNPRTLPSNLNDGTTLLVPVQCACPSSVEMTKFLVSYPVREGDTLSQLAMEFNVTLESIVSANNRHSKAGFKLQNGLLPFSTLLFPTEGKPIIGILSKPQSQKPNSRYPEATIQVKKSHKKSRNHKKLIVGVIVGIVGFLASVTFGAAYFIVKRQKMKRSDPITNEDSDQLQGLSSSVRTTSGKKVSFEESQNNSHTTPYNMITEKNYSFDELRKATEDFSSSNLIEGSVYHGRLKGENMAIKRIPTDVISRTNFRLFNNHHPNIIRLLGTCVTDGTDSFVVLEYATNGSLKDWIHGGLAIKSQFISSCNCFLTWKQRLKICLDVATALHYMHCTISPSYGHGSISSRNIFLDEEFNAKIGSNFGVTMANCLEHEQGITISSPSVDVFDYGVVLLEVLSGKVPMKRVDEGSFVKVSDEMKRVLQSECDEEGLREWMDGALLGENYSFDGAVTVAKLARCCLEDEPSSRPDAGEIVEKLRSLVDLELPEEDQFSFRT